MAMRIRVGEVLQYQGVSVFPLFQDTDAQIDYQLSDEAIAAGTLVVGELAGGASVPDLIVENKSPRRVLFLEGEELVGAKQNRILNTSVLVAAESTIKIPVSCVEQGRWRYRSRGFGSSGHHSSSEVRRSMACSVTRSVQAKLGHRSDQSEVWAAVKREQEELGVASETSAMSDTHESRKSIIDEFRENLAYVPGASGLVVAVGQKVVALDMFDKADTCGKAWGRLLSGFVLDAMRRRPVEDDRAQPAEVQRLVDLFGSVSWKQAAAVGEGEEYRALVQSGEHAFKLCLAGSVVHASILASA